MEALARLLRRELEAEPRAEEFARRCLSSMRWGGSVVLMVVDAAITSAGLGYFTAVVPRVLRFKEELVDTGRVSSLESLASADDGLLLRYWANRRSWSVARGVAGALLRYGRDDRERLRSWASSSRLEGWRSDPVGSVKGVGLITYQYLRMMGGVDTAMPDRVVKRYVASLARGAGVDVPEGDAEFIGLLEALRDSHGVSPVAVTWLSWLRLSEGDEALSRYRDLLELL
ncbi:MAG: hypothetical protein RXR70_04985 [Acidilobus sp.]